MAFSLIKTNTKLNRTVVSYEPTRKNEKDKRCGSSSCLERIKDRFGGTKGLKWNELFQKDM